LSKDALDPDTVLALARVAGLPIADADMAARIAAGASAAISAVRSSLGETLFDFEPADFSATLERLAVDPPDGRKRP
jgi:hypothetical protein